MKLSLLTRESVLAAIYECDRRGRDVFLADHGFARALDYFLLYGGRPYDSKAIAAYAYSQVSGEPPENNFSGGEGVANGALRKLGFEVTGPIDWSRDELVITCDVLVGAGWNSPRANTPEVQRLSDFLRAQNPRAVYSDRFRSPSSVHRKLEDLRSARPGYAGDITKGGKLTAEVAAAFDQDPARMHAVAELLWTEGLLTQAADLEHLSGTAADDDAEATAEAVEGSVIQSLVTRRERDPKLRAAKIAWSRQVRGSISCEVCSFDFEETYGTVGEGYIEVHHRVPLFSSGRVTTKLEDLILLCANCHRMIHATRDWRTPEELAQVLSHRV